MPLRQWLYLALAFAGLASTWTFNVKFMLADGGNFDLWEFIRQGYANDASSSLVNDLVVAANAFLVWSFVEVRRLGMRRWWPYFVLTNAVAFAFAFPLFLFVRDRHLAAAGDASAQPA